MQPCDVLGLALVYDVYSFAGLYPNCTHEIPNTLDGLLKTKVTETPSTTYECIGTGVTLSGAATIGLDSANYQKLSGNPLWARDLDVQRKLHSASTWTTIATVVVQSNATGSWSKVVSSAAGTWDYRTVYAGETALHSTFSPTATVTWGNPC